MTIGWESFGGWGIFFIALAYALAGLKLANVFESKHLLVPAGICATFAVALTPLAIYGLQHALGLWPDGGHYHDYHRYIRWSWLYMELGTLLVGSLVAWRYRYPFLTMPIAITLWYLSMDIAALMADGWASFAFRATLSLYFGLAMTILAVWVDFRSKNGGDYAFWLYLFGVMTFWGGLSAQHSGSEFGRLIYCLVNLAMIGTGVLLRRKVFVIFGAFGVAFYLGHLAFSLFRNSWLFPMALTAIGLGIIWLGVLWQKNEKAITEKARNLLPQPIRDFLGTKGM
jgi:hypothetical protein